MKKISWFIPLAISFSFITCKGNHPIYGLDILQGDWIRITSNNSRSDSMQILVRNDSAIINFVPQGSSFSVGQRKWAEIKSTARDAPSKRGDFTLYDLSGNLAEYQATIFVDNDTLELKNMTFPNAPGATQYWIKY